MVATAAAADSAVVVVVVAVQGITKRAVLVAQAVPLKLEEQEVSVGQAAMLVVVMAAMVVHNPAPTAFLGLLQAEEEAVQNR